MVVRRPRVRIRSATVAIMLALGAGCSSRVAAPRPAPPPIRESLLWPVPKGRFTSAFGLRDGSRHDGVDIAAPTGTPVRAAATGIVSFVGTVRGYGNFVKVFHMPGLSTAYGHNDEVLVRVGQLVRRGETIALVGETGRTTGPNLHFEVHRAGVPVDPMAYFIKRRPGSAPARVSLAE